MDYCVPQPIPQRVVCSLCGLDWASHGPNPTVLDCIRILKAKVHNQQVPRPQPWVPRPNPYWPYDRGYWCQSNAVEAQEKLAGRSHLRRPAKVEAKPQPVYG